MSCVRREAGYLKKGLFEPAVDPLVRASGGLYWQNVYMPYSLGKKEVVLQFSYSSADLQAALDEYSAETGRMKRSSRCSRPRWCLRSRRELSFMHNFTLLIDGLSASIKKASAGELDVNLNAGADAELMELATSFNSLVGGMRELKEREKSFEERKKSSPNWRKDTLVYLNSG